MDIKQSDQWMPIEDAALATREPIALWNRRAEREAREAVDQNRPPRAVRAVSYASPDRRVWWVRRSIHPALLSAAAKLGTEDRHSWVSIADVPERIVDRAYRKEYWLLRWRKLLDAGDVQYGRLAAIHSGIIAEARKIDGPRFRISVGSLRHWWRSYTATIPSGDIRGVRALIDRRVATGFHRDRSTSLAYSRDPRAVEYFLRLFRGRRNLSVQSCHIATLAKASRKGWAWARRGQSTRKWLRTYGDRRFLERKRTRGRRRKARNGSQTRSDG